MRNYLNVFKTNQTLFGGFFLALVSAVMTTPVVASGIDRPTPFVEVIDPYMNSMPSMVKMTAAYMTLSNPSDKSLTFIGASSSAAKQVELHRTSFTNGMMKMRLVPTLTIPARGEIELSPGGLHLMLKQLKRPLQSGEYVPITLLFSEKQQLTIRAYIRDQKGEQSHHGH